MKCEQMTNAQRSAAGFCYVCCKPYVNAHIGIECPECWKASLGELAIHLTPETTYELGNGSTTE